MFDYCERNNFSLDEVFLGENLFEEAKNEPLFQEFLQSYRRYRKLQRRSDKEIVEQTININGMRRAIDLFEGEIQRRKEYKPNQSTTSSDRSTDHGAS